MATLIYPITRLVDTLRQWRDRERQVVIRELAGENRTPDLCPWRSTTVWYLPMMSVFVAAATVVGLGMGPAYADGGGQGPTLFTMIEAQLAAKAQGRDTAKAATPTGGPASYFYSTRPHSQGTWLFAPGDGGGANN